LQNGRNIATPVSHAYEVPFAFTGKLDTVTIDLGVDQTPKTKGMIAPEKDRHVDFD
jgi:hypothetical protein